MKLNIVEPVDEPGLAKLKRIESRIKDGDQKGLRARWDSGKLLREMRESDPEKTLEEYADQLGVSQPELSYRMRFAESEQALINAIDNGWSWYDVTQHMTELVGRKRAPRQVKVGPLVAAFRLSSRRLRSDLRKTHAKDLSEADFRTLDEIQEEIARIYDEIGADK